MSSGLRPDQDAYGREIRAAHEGRHVPEIIERDDGFIDSMGGYYLLAPYPKWDANERKAIRLAHGRVLDVGAGGGRVSLHLQSKGHKVVAIDNSPLAIRVCKKRGVKDARLLRFEDIDDSLGTFDTIVMYGNNFGLFGTPSRAKKLLRRLHKMTSKQARIIAETRNPYATKDRGHLAYHERNRKRGRLGGQLRIRARHRDLKTPWFDYLFVSPTEMREIVDGTGWHISRTLPGAEGQFIAVLEKD